MTLPDERSALPYGRVVIAGVGLIGGSLAIDLRELRLAREVIGLVRRPEAAAEALARGMVDAAGCAPAIARGAELVVLAGPVAAIPAQLEQLAPHLAPGCVVTDVASTKAELMRLLPARMPPGTWLIGGHPMAGSERAGMAHARGGLFIGAAWPICPAPGVPAAAIARLEALIRSLGAEPLRLDPAVHDAIVARVSHLPHVVAAVLATAALGDGDGADLLRRLASTGFRDTTRIAAGSAPLWRDICLSNRAALLAALDRFEAMLGEFRRALAEGREDAVAAALEAGRTARARLVPDGGERL